MRSQFIQRLIPDVGALLIPLAACWIQWQVWDSIEPSAWILFLPAVFVSTRVGGIVSGAAATILSAILVVYFFLPPQYSFAIENRQDWYTVSLFLVMGALFILTHHQLRKNAEPKSAASHEGHKANTRRAPDPSLCQLREGVSPSATLRQAAPPAGGDDNSIGVSENDVRLRLALEASRAGLWDWHIPSGRVIIDERWAETIGFTLRELEPFDIHKWAALCHPEDIKESDAILEECIRGACDHYAHAKRMRRKNGDWAWMMDRGMVVERSQDGKPLRMVGTRVDITDRKKSEEVAREREAILQTALDATGETIFILDTKGVVLGLNSTAAERLGTSRDAMLGRPVYEFLPPNVSQWRKSQGEKAIQSKHPVFFEDERIGRWLENAVYPVMDDHGEVAKIVVYSRDITARKKAESVQRWQQRVLERAEELAHVGSWAYDVEDNQLHLSEEWKQIHGIAREVRSMEEIMPLVHPDDLPRVKEALDRSVREGVPYEIQHRILRQSDGETRHLYVRGEVRKDENGCIVEFFGATQDITKDVLSEEALRESEEKYRFLIENQSDFVIHLNVDGTFRFASPKLCDMFGISLGELCGQSLLQRIHSDDREAILTSLKCVMSPPYERSFVGRSLTVTEWRWLSWSARAVLSNEGQVSSIVGVGRDITEKHEAEAAIARETRISEVRLALLQSAQDSPMQDLLRETVDHVCRLTESPIGFYHFLEEDQRTISLQVWSTATERDFCTADGAGLHYDREKAGVWADCIREGRPVIHNDYASLPNRQGMPEGHAEVIRELVVPVLRGDKIVAVLGVGNKSSDYTQEEVDTVFRLADLAWDIVGRKLAEDATRASEARLQKFFSLGLIGMTISSTEKDWIAFNDHMCNMLGYTREELVQKSWAELTHPEDLEADVSQWNQVMSGEIESYTMRKRYIRKDGAHLHALLSVSVVRKADGSVDYFLALVYDISDLIATQEALTRSNESYNSFISQSHEAIYRTDLDAPVDISLPVEEQVDAIYANAYIGECNQAMAEMYGALSPEHLIGKRLAELHADRQRPGNRATVRRFIESGYRVVDNETEEEILPDIRRWFLSNDVGVVENGKLIRVWGTCVDITERKQAEEALRVSEERYRALLETISDWIWEVDEAGRYTYVGPRVTEILGYTPNELIGRTPFEIMPEDEAHRVGEAFGQIVSEQRPFYCLENTCIRKDGTLAVMETSGVPVLDSEGRFSGYRGIDRDVTERKEAEQALREREQQHRDIIQTAQDGFWLTDTKGRLLQVNDAYCRMSGYSQEELLGMRIADLEAAETEIETAEHMRRLIDVGYDRFETRHRCKNGAELCVEVSAQYRPGNGGRLVIFVRDITSHKLAETERVRLEDQLRQSQKMEAIGQLAGGVAHDFNNLLQVMMGYVQLAAGDLGKGHPLRQELREVVKAGERAKDLVNQLLTFSRRQIMRPASLDLNEVITGFLKMLNRVIGEHIRLDFVPGRDIGAIYADRGMIEQVLMNLCVNARDAMGPSGTLTIETASIFVDEEHMEAGGFTLPGPYVELKVSDTGFGMDAETLLRIFDPFFTTKELGKGTGLGLSTVYGIVGQHNGVIQARSEPNLGSTFTVYLPVVEQPTESVASDIAIAPPGGTETILLAEDDEGVRKLASRILREAGYRVVLAEDGEDALERFKEHRDGIQLLILDVVMPKMGGREAFERIRELDPGIPVLFASGYAEDALHSGFTLPEGMSLIRKPYMPEDLLLRIREAFRMAQSSKVTP